MKNVLPLHCLIFCIFLFALPTSNLADRLLLDTDGNELRNGGSYYIVSAFKGKGGGLELSKTGTETCPLTVVQALSETSKGLPATIWTPPRIAILIPGFDLKIEFEPQNPSPCYQQGSSLQWKVEEKSQVVKIASNQEERVFGSFQIQPYKDVSCRPLDYKLVYCERKYYYSRERDCKDLGISTDGDSNRRLVVKDGDPLIVRFVNADRGGDSARFSIV